MKQFIKAHGPAIASGIIVGIFMLTIQHVLMPKIVDKQMKQLKQKNTTKK